MDEIDHEADASAPGRGGSRNAAGGVSAAVTPRKGGKSAPAVEASPVQSQPTAKPRTATGGSKAAAAGSAEGDDASASSPAALRPSRGRKATVEGGEASGATPAPAKRTRKPAAPEQ
jgi:hypothetical protein